MDHTIGKLVVPILTGKSSGRPSARAIQSPRIAPTNPSAIETRQPPRENPVIAWPSDPQIPATISRMRRSNNVMGRIITAPSCSAPVLAADNLRGAPPRLPTCAVMPRLIRLSHMRLCRDNPGRDRPLNGSAFIHPISIIIAICNFD